MDEEIRKHAMILFLGMVACALINVKLSSSRLKTIKKPMREKVSVFYETSSNQTQTNFCKDEETGQSNNTREDAVQIVEMFEVENLSQRSSWGKVLGDVYERLTFQESVILCVSKSNLAQVAALVYGCFESVNRPIVVTTNTDEDFEYAKTLISKNTSPYIVAVCNGILLSADNVSNSHVVGSNYEFNEKFKKSIKPSSDVYLKRPDLTRAINILSLHPGMDYEKTIYCALTYSEGVIIDNRAGVNLRLDLQDDEVYANRLVWVVGKKIKVTCPTLKVLHDESMSPEYAFVKICLTPPE